MRNTLTFKQLIGECSSFVLAVYILRLRAESNHDRRGALHRTRLKMAVNEFSAVDYVVFGCMLLISSAIGVYHAYGGKQSSTKEYLMAGKGMGLIPITISLLVSYLSAITLLGVPSEIYTYGVQYCVLLFSYFILCTTAAVIYAPLFYRLNITSAHEVAIHYYRSVFAYFVICLHNV